MAKTYLEIDEAEKFALEVAIISFVNGLDLGEDPMGIKIAEGYRQRLLQVLAYLKGIHSYKEYDVYYYYLTTGMEGRAVSHYYGRYAANSSEEAIEQALKDCKPEDRSSVKSCLTAKEVT